MFPTFLSLTLSVGSPPMYAALIIAAFANLSGCLSHYRSAEAPIY